LHLIKDLLLLLLFVRVLDHDIGEVGWGCPLLLLLAVPHVDTRWVLGQPRLRPINLNVEGTLSALLLVGLPHQLERLVMQVFLATLVGQSGGWLVILLQYARIQQVELSLLLEVRELVLS
jgi:hypothetical protein